MIYCCDELKEYILKEYNIRFIDGRYVIDNYDQEYEAYDGLDIIIKFCPFCGKQLR